MICLMGLGTTSERYEYIFGSNARELAPSRSRTVRQPQKAAKKAGPRKVSARTMERRAMEKARREEEEAARHRAWFLEFDWKYTVVIITAVLVCSFACLFYVWGIAGINRMQQDIYQLKSEKMELAGKRTALQAEVDKAINLKQVEEYAKKRLKMKYPDNESVIHYRISSEDYFRKYENTDTK